MHAVSSAFAFRSALYKPDCAMTYAGPPALVSFLAWALYRISWVTDPCSRYEAPSRPQDYMRSLPVRSVERKDFFIVKRKRRWAKDAFVATCALSAALLCSIRLIRSFR